MSHTVRRLAQWARSLTSADVPPAILERVRLQHLSVAGACRAVKDRPLAKVLRKAGGKRGAADLITGGSAPKRDAVRLHAGLSVWLDHDDYLFMGHTGHGGVTAAWAHAKGHNVDALLTATVAANEVAGRVGASMLLGPTNGQGWAAVSAVSAAVSAGLLEGLSADELAHAIALALAMPHRVPKGRWILALASHLDRHT